MNDEPTIFVAEYRWLKARVGVDLINLDQDVSEISELLQKAGECCARAIEIKDAAKDDLELAKAQACDRLRQTPTANNKERSETSIASQYPLDPEYRSAQVALREAQGDAELWQRLQENLKTKSFNLKICADLIISGFVSRDYILEKRRGEIRSVVVPARQVKS